jgi:hypothetical protein
MNILTIRDMVLLPDALRVLKRVSKLLGWDLKGSYLNLDGGFDSKHNRKVIFNVGMIPNIKENPRNRKTTKRGRKRLFNQAIHRLRDRVERTFAWEDKFKRLLMRFERIQCRHYAMKLMAYTMINVSSNRSAKSKYTLLGLMSVERYSQFHVPGVRRL